MGYKLEAQDGPIGKVKDFLFDEAQWTVRWMVADTGKWLPKRKVLVSPITLGEPDWKTGLLPVRLTNSEIENSPALDSDAPVSRQYEQQWFDSYGWPHYWGGAGVWGAGFAPTALYTRQAAERVETPQSQPEAGGDIVRSASEVRGYHIKARDGEIGHLEDLILDDETWTLRYLVVDTANWLPGRKVLVAPAWVESIRWADRLIAVGLTRDEVKNSPAYDPYTPVNREYEARLYDYYGRPVYWG
jgi:hypothetical protein